MSYLERDDRIQYEGNTGYPKAPAPDDDVLFGIWCREWAKAIYSNWQGNSRSGYGYRDYLLRYYKNRRLAEGDQSVEQYKDLFPSTTNPDGDDGSWVNIDYTPLKIASVLFRKAVNMVYRRIVMPVATAIDPTTQSEKRAEINYQYSRIKEMDLLHRVGQIMGKPILQPKEGEPENMDQFKIYEGSYKHDIEQDVEVIADITFDANDWPTQKREMIRDMMACGPAAAIEYSGPNGAGKIERIRPEDLVISYSEREDLKDIWYGGRFKYYTEASLRSFAGDAFNESEWTKIKEQIGDGNQIDHPYYDQHFGGVSNENTRGENKILVLHITWQSWVQPKYKSVKLRGNDKAIKLPDHYTPKKLSPSEEFVQKKFDVWYECYWIVGTNFVFRHKMMNNIKRDANDLGKCNPPVVAFMPNQDRMQSIPLIENMEPHIHMIQNAWNKIQNFIAELRPNELAIDENMLVSTGFGKGGEFGTEVLKFFQQKGIYIYNSRDEETGVPMNYPPMHNMNTDTSYKFTVLWEIFQRNINLLMTSIGMDPQTAGQAPANDVVVAAMQQQVIGTDHALFDYARGIDSITERLAENAIGRYQVISRYKDVEGIMEALGPNTWRRLKLNSDISTRVLGIKIDATYSGDMRERLVNWIEFSIQEYSRTNGRTGITLPEAEEVTRAMQSNVKIAMDLLSYKIDKREKEFKEMEERKMQTELQKVQEAQQQNAQAQLAKVEADKAATLEVENAKSGFKMNENRELHQQKMEQIALTNDGLVASQVTRSEGDIEKEEKKGDQKMKEIEKEGNIQKDIARLKTREKSVNS